MFFNKNNKARCYPWLLNFFQSKNFDRSGLYALYINYFFVCEKTFKLWFKSNVLVNKDDELFTNC